MATLEQLENALRKAHAAGNVDHARAFAAEIRRMRDSAPKADFSNVQGGVQSTESLRQGFAAVPAGYGNYRPTLGPRQQRQAVSEMSAGRKVVEGANAALERTGRGIGQVIALGLDAVAPRQQTLSSLVTGQPVSRAGQMEAAESVARARDAELLADGWGRTGAILGDIGTALIPIGRAAQLGRAGQIGVSAATGAGMGFLQPVTADESRATNTAVGLGAGAVTPVALAGAGKLAGLVAKPLRAFTERGANSQAGAILRRFATDEAALTRSAPSAIPGVQRTLAEETLDPGIAQLQRQFPVELADVARSNNAARTDYLANAFGGADEATSAAIREGADREATQMARQLRGVVNQQAPSNPFAGLGVQAPRQSQAITLDSVTSGIDGLISKNNNRPLVQDALRYVRNLSQRPVGSASEAWNLRKTINDLMEGRLSGDLQAATAARRELLTVRGLLDRQMNKALPGWSEFLRTYKGSMRSADQVDVGAHLLAKGGVQGLDAQGNAVRTLQPGKFRNLTDDMDRAVQSATGFRRATAEGALTPDQLQAVGNVRDDVIRMMDADSVGRARGSNTAQNLVTESRLADELGRSRLGSLAQRVPGIRWATESLNDAAQKRVQAAVAEALANPQRARAILAAHNPQERAVIEAMLTQAASAGAVGIVPTVQGY